MARLRQGPTGRTVARLQADALDFAPGILAIQEKPAPPLPRLVLYSLLALFAIMLLWAVLGHVDIVAVAEGKLVPQTYVKIVQPADSGILREILVKEGDRVAAGQPLMRMDARLSEADSRILQAEIEQRALQVRRIDAELSGRALKRQKSDPPELFAQIEAQYLSHRRAYEDALAQEEAALAKAREELAAARQVQDKLKQVLPVYQAQEQAWGKLGRDGFAGKLMVLDKQRERVEKEHDLRSQDSNVESLRAAIAQSEKRLAQITSSYRQQLYNERVEAEAALHKLRQEWAKQQHRHTLLELKAPQAGVIKDVATHTAGTVVSPGTILLTLVPVNEPLQAEVMIKNEDVGFVRAGQKVKLKLAAYPFQKYGMVDGAVVHVSADASETPGPKGEEIQSGGLQLPAIYKAIVQLNTQFLEADGARFSLTPGMQVVAEIKQGERTILEYLLSPVQKAFHEAARER